MKTILILNLIMITVLGGFVAQGCTSIAESNNTVIAMGIRG